MLAMTKVDKHEAWDVSGAENLMYKLTDEQKECVPTCMHLVKGKFLSLDLVCSVCPFRLVYENFMVSHFWENKSTRNINKF